MADNLTYKLGNVAIKLGGLSPEDQPYARSVINSILGNAEFIGLFSGSRSVTISFGDLGNPALRAFTNGNSTPTPSIQFNSTILSLDNAKTLVIVTTDERGNAVIKEFGSTFIHELLHVAFPNLTGSGPNGHSNPTGDYLFRVMTRHALWQSIG